MQPRSSRSCSLRSSISFGFLVACGLILAPAAAPASSLKINGFSQATNDPDGQNLLELVSILEPLSAGAASAGASTLGSGTATGTVAGTADYGVLRALATGTASGPFPESGVAGGSVESSWFDTFTIFPSNPILDGQQGTFVFLIQLTGGLTADGGGAAESNTLATYRLTVDAGTCISGCDFDVSGYMSDNGSQLGGMASGGDPIGSFTSTPVPFNFGVPVDLTVKLGAFAQAVAGVEGATSEASANLFNTLVWGGFLEVRDASGGLVDSYAVTSDSTVDWSQAAAVPEPTLGLYLIVGLLGLAARHGAPAARASSPRLHD